MTLTHGISPDDYVNYLPSMILARIQIIGVVKVRSLPHLSLEIASFLQTPTGLHLFGILFPQKS